MAERCCHGTAGCSGKGEKHWCQTTRPKRKTAKKREVQKADPPCDVHHYLMPDGHCTCPLSVEGEIRAFLDALGSDANIEAIGSVGKFRCRKKLSSGAVVTFSYSEPRR